MLLYEAFAKSPNFHPRKGPIPKKIHKNTQICIKGPSIDGDSGISYNLHMEPDKFSLRRVASWIRCIEDEKQSYFPAPAITDEDKATDKYIKGRFGVLTHALMRVDHASLMKPRGVLEIAGRRADLPEELFEVYAMYLRTVFFTKSGGFTPNWWSVLTTLNPPASGWPNLVFEAGMLNILKGVTPHEESRFGLFFKVLHGNMREYKAYRTDQTELINGGKSVRVLSPEDYFKSKGWSEEGEGIGALISKEPVSRKTTPVEVMSL